MVVSILNKSASDNIEAKLADLDVRTRRFTRDSVQDLSHGSADLVYVVPFAVLAEPDWPQLRVRLAQANRYYLVVGDKLDSGAIMSAARDGAYDVLLVSDLGERWLKAVNEAANSQKLWLQLYGGTPLSSGDSLLGHSTAMKALRQAIERLGPTMASVLILGESGVG